MFTALTITHFLLNRMVDFHIRNPKAYGLRERKEEKKHFPILKNFKIFSGISAVLIVTGLVALILLPFGKNLFNLSIDFAGGTEMEFNMHTAVTQDIQTEVSDLFKDATGVDASSVTSSGDGNEDVLIRSTSIDSEQRAAVIDKMLEKYSLADTDILNNNDVSASVGSDLQRSAFICSILAIPADAGVHHLPLRADQWSGCDLLPGSRPARYAERLRSAADSARQQLHRCCTDHPRLLDQRVHHRIRPRS